MATRSARHLIVGGGIIGCATAYHLAVEAARPVREALEARPAAPRYRATCVRMPQAVVASSMSGGGARSLIR